MALAVADQEARTRGTGRGTDPFAREGATAERLPLLVTLVAVVLFGVCWLFGLAPALREERGINARLTAALKQEQRVRETLQDRRQGMAVSERDPEELIRALDETSTPPPPAPPAGPQTGTRSGRTSTPGQGAGRAPAPR